MMKHRTLLQALVAVTLLLGTASCKDTATTQQQPTAATTDTVAATLAGTSDYHSTGDARLLHVKLPAGIDNEVVKYHAITIHYNSRHRIPNCVAYELTATQVAMADAPDAEQRSDYNFERDKAVKGCPDWWEYKNTGYDRGHMAPAMDMRWSSRAMTECFLMTNMCPQVHALNDGEWRHMEEAIHRWARKAQRLVIFTGPVLSAGMKTTGSKHNIAVPERFYKVVYAPEQERAIAFLFDNKEATRSWTRYATTVDEVERLTGIDFLAALPDDVEARVESHQNINDWPRYTPRR